MNTPCYGKHELFDSLDPRDHRVARKLCQTCPLIKQCAQNLEDVKRNGGLYGQPEGTWAGQFAAPQTEATRKRLAAIARSERYAAEEARYSAQEARLAHNAYSGGNRTEWAKTGHRVYDRRRKNQRGSAA